MMTNMECHKENCKECKKIEFFNLFNSISHADMWEIVDMKKLKEKHDELGMFFPFIMKDD